MTKQLRELEEEGLVQRTVYPVVPPMVEYALTEEARSMEPLLIGLSNWGEQWLARRGIVLPDLKDAQEEPSSATPPAPSEA